MFTKFSEVKTALNHKIADLNIHDRSAIDAALTQLEAKLNTRHSLFLNQFASLIIAFECAAWTQNPYNAFVGYYLSRSTFFQNMHTWYLLTPENIPMCNGIFCASTINIIRNSDSVDALVLALNSTGQEVDRYNHALTNLTSTLCGAAGSCLGFYLGSTTAATNILFPYNWPGKYLATQAVFTGLVGSVTGALGCIQEVILPHRPS